MNILFCCPKIKFEITDDNTNIHANEQMKTANAMLVLTHEAKVGVEIRQRRGNGGESGFGENLVGKHQKPSYSQINDCYPNSPSQANHRRLSNRTAIL